MPRLEEAGVTLIAVSVDPPNRSANFVKVNGFRFPVLADETRETIKAYDTWNEENDIALPMTLILDREGVVRWRYQEVDYTIRPSTEEVVEEALKLALEK